MVQVQKRLVEHLGIERLRAVVGGSLGGHMALTWAIGHPVEHGRRRGPGHLAPPDQPGPGLRRRRPQRHPPRSGLPGRPILRCDRRAGGGAVAGADAGAHHLPLAGGDDAEVRRRATRARQILTQFENKFSVGSYLAYQGDKFVERFDPNSYLTLSMAMDLFELGDTPQKLAASLAVAQCRWLVLSFTSDWLFPAFQSQEMVDALIAGGKPVSYCNVRSNCGHDAFLLAEDLDCYGEMMRAFLAHLDDEGSGAAAAHDAPSDAADEPYSHAPTSIFHRRRLDYDSILELIPAGASVLDLGCGTGGLLARLRERGQRRLMGMELDQGAILACVRRGLDVVQADLNAGLAAFPDKQFDFVVLSQTLQAVLDVERVLADVLRVGRRGIVSFPQPRPLEAPPAAFRAGPRPRTGHCWASIGTTRQTSAFSPSTISTSSAGRRGLPYTSTSPWTPTPAWWSATIRT